MEVNWFVTIIIGLILGIPFSIFANIYTPKISLYFEKRRKTISEKRKLVLKKELEEVENYNSDKMSFMNLAVTSSLKVTFAAQIFSIITVVIYGVPQTFELLDRLFPSFGSNYFDFIRQAFYLFGNMMNLFLAVYLLQIVRKPIEIFKKINTLDDYKKEINELLNKNE